MPDYEISISDGILSFLSKEVGTEGKKTVFLDRDGVLNLRIEGGYVTRWSEFTLLPGVKDALRSLSESGFQLVIVSNQAGVAKGKLSGETLIEITQRALEEFSTAGGLITEALFCLHQPSDNCGCRKPQPGLLRKAMQELPVNTNGSFMVGDSPADIEAGSAVGLRTIYVTEHATPAVPADAFAKDLEGAVQWIQNCRPSSEA